MMPFWNARKHAENSASVANPYLERNEAIAYNITKLPDGWKIEATLPKQVSASDRASVINWFRAYRADVRLKNPTWLANFYVSNNRYSLEIKPAQDIRQLAEAGEKVKEIWGETLKYAQR